MSNVEVMFFAADPHSVPSNFGGPGEKPRLLIDEELRQIREKVRSAEYRDRLHLNANLATRTDDLLQLLNERRPDVVHFSGHGGAEGIVLVGMSPTQRRRVDLDALTDVFRVLKGDIKVVVLNACWSLRQAQAIRDVVGCAIGTPTQIKDEAAIAFSASFYRAIAFGKSVQEAFDQGCTALKLDHFDALQYPQLLCREDVNPSDLVLIRPEPAQAAVPPFEENNSVQAPPNNPPASRLARHAAIVATVVAITGGGGYILYDSLWRDRPSGVDGVMAAVGRAESMTPDSALAQAVDLHLAGQDSAAFPYFLRAANADIPEAMAYLGTAYLEGKGINPQPRLGATLVREAAEQGSIRGMLRLALAYQRGEGVNRNRRHARTWFLKAANLGSAEALRNLGLLYREEFVADSGYAPVLHWRRRAVEAGSLDAMVDLGWMYETGDGVPADSAAARRLYTRAADAGLPRAMVFIGRFYQARGEYARALAWYRKGAEERSPDALYALGVMYENGWGVPVDLEEARRLYQQAADGGSEVARAKLQALGDR